MVVHLAPGNYTGTLVNALLHHCALPPLPLAVAGPSAPPSSAPCAAPAQDGPALPLPGGAGLQGAPVLPESSDWDELDEDEDECGEGGLSFHSLGDPLAASLPSSSEALAPGGSSNPHRALRPGIVHRLDKGTSGLLVVAKSEAALTRLQAQFKARTVGALLRPLQAARAGQRAHGARRRFA
jgi:23S rRNA pseudouridine1911/1915/1917 synthase